MAPVLTAATDRGRESLSIGRASEGRVLHGSW
jgi:hypothetical protein